jgi:hypothetical protein
LKKIPVLFLLSLVATVWLVPFLIDWVRYKNLPQSCAGVFTYSGKIDEDSLWGRHCASGVNVSSSEAGFEVSFEFATGGRIMAYGRRNNTMLESTPCTSGSCDLNQALLRTPGDDPTWYCAASGTYQNPEGEIKFSLTEVSALSTNHSDKTAQAEFSGGLQGKLTIDQVVIKGAELWGRNCAENNHRCDFEIGKPGASSRVFVRAAEPIRNATLKEVLLEDAFILREDGRSPKQVTLLQTKPNSGSTISYDGTKLTLKLKGLSEPAKCPGEPTGSGSITASNGGSLF